MDELNEQTIRRKFDPVFVIFVQLLFLFVFVIHCIFLRPSLGTNNGVALHLVV